MTKEERKIIILEKWSNQATIMRIAKRFPGSHIIVLKDFYADKRCRKELFQKFNVTCLGTVISDQPMDQKMGLKSKDKPMLTISGNLYFKTKTNLPEQELCEGLEGKVVRIFK